MTESELQATYKRAYRIIQRERFMRQHVFRNDPDKMAEKVGEMDVLLRDVTAMKDAIKATLPPPMQQAALIDVPTRRAEWQ